jgi:ABC-type Fe3+/spermidine/putrescine transport system ATPase subunit
MADRLAVMDMGRVEQTGDPRTLYSRPANRFVADFIGEINLIAGEVAAVEDDVRVDTALGPITGRPGTDGLADGQGVLCAFRPEAVAFLVGEPSEGDNVVSGQVRDVVYLGDLEQYVVDLVDGTEVRVVEHNPTRRIAEPGDGVRLRFGRQAVVVLSDEDTA